MEFVKVKYYDFLEDITNPHIVASTSLIIKIWSQDSSETSRNPWSHTQFTTSSSTTRAKVRISATLRKYFRSFRCETTWRYFTYSISCWKRWSLWKSSTKWPRTISLLYFRLACSGQAKRWLSKSWCTARNWWLLWNSCWITTMRSSEAKKSVWECSESLLESKEQGSWRRTFKEHRRKRNKNKDLKNKNRKMDN